MNWYKELKFADNNVQLNQLEDKIFSLLKNVVNQPHLQQA